MIFDLWPLPKALGGRDQKNGAVACGIYVNNSHTKSGWISGFFLFDPQSPHGTPKSHPWGMTQAAKWKSPSDIFHIFHFWEDTQSLV